ARDIARLAGFAFRLREFVQNARRPRDEALAARRQSGAPPIAFEQRLAKFLLQLAHLLTERWLRDMAVARGAAETPRAGHGDRIAKLMHFHGRCLILDMPAWE